MKNLYWLNKKLIMKPFISANCIIFDENRNCYAIVKSINENEKTFSVEYNSPDTGKIVEMVNIPFLKFRLILYYVGGGWVKETYIYQWCKNGEEVFTNNGITRLWEDVKNNNTNLFIDKQIANSKVANSYMSKMI